MIYERGHFSVYDDPSRAGLVMQNEDGVDWHHYVLSRVMFDGRGAVLKLFEHGSLTDAVEGDRFFANVRDGVVEFVSNRDLSRLEPRDCLVIEAYELIEVGMLYTAGELQPAPPPPPEPHTREKGAVINSFDDDQFELWDERFRTAPARQRVTWNNGTMFTSDSEEWPTIQALFVHVFGEEVGKDFFPDHPTAQ